MTDVKINLLTQENANLQKEIFRLQRKIDEIQKIIDTNEKFIYSNCKHQWETDVERFEPCGLTPQICTKCGSHR
jgi:hypothetical protein